MADTPAGARLTELHRLLQVKLSTQAMAATRLLWPTLDLADLEGSEWMQRQITLTQVFDKKAAAAAAAYMGKYRAAEGFPGGPIEGVDSFSSAWAESSLGWNGPGKIEYLKSLGLSPNVAKEQAFSTVAAATQRLVLGGGRRVLDESALANPKSAGWRRVPDSSPCTFCAQMVSRGVYESAHAADEGRHWHRRCACSVEEVFGEWTPTPREQEYVDSYHAAIKKLKADGEPLTPANIMNHMREHGQFNDSPDAKAAAKPEPIVKTQLSGSFAPKPATPVAVEKTQLTGSFAPKPAVIEKTQLKGSFAPKAPPAPPAAAAPAQAKSYMTAILKGLPKKAKPLGEIEAEAVKPGTLTPEAEPVRRRFKSSSDGKSWASKIWPGPKGYKTDELRALRAYTDEGYRRTNAALRASKGERGGSRGMQSAMDSAPRVPEDIVVSRGTTARQFGLPDGADLSKLAGKSFTEHGYLSTSVDVSGRLADDVRLRLSVPKGHKAVYVSGAPGASDTISAVGGSEAELILDKGVQFRITSVKRVKGKWQIDADIIGQ